MSLGYIQKSEQIHSFFVIPIIIGMIIAPVRFGIYGSFNGNQGKLKVPGKKSGKHKKENEE